MDEKVYSIFETHTDLIKRGKARKPVEFGHKVFLAESAQGLITDYQVLEETRPIACMWGLRWNVIRRPSSRLPSYTRRSRLRQR